MAILEYEHPDEADVDPEHGEICCLMQAESPDGIEEPLAELIRSLREKNGALRGVRQLLLLDIVELPNTPGNAVLWSSSWRYIRSAGFANVRGPLLIDYSGSGAMHEWVHEKNKADRAANRPHTIEPFMVFEDGAST